MFVGVAAGRLRRCLCGSDSQPRTAGTRSASSRGGAWRAPSLRLHRGAGPFRAVSAEHAPRLRRFPHRLVADIDEEDAVVARRAGRESGDTDSHDGGVQCLRPAATRRRGAHRYPRRYLASGPRAGSALLLRRYVALPVDSCELRDSWDADSVLTVSTQAIVDMPPAPLAPPPTAARTTGSSSAAPVGSGSSGTTTAPAVKPEPGAAPLHLPKKVRSRLTASHSLVCVIIA